MIDPADFAFLAQFLKARSGLALPEGKEYLLEGRLVPVATEYGCTSVRALVELLRRSPGAGLENRVIEAMMTHETMFFRDQTPFEALSKVILPHLQATRRAEGAIRIWCAAASTGQEPYSIAMLIRENHRHTVGPRVEILATDISASVVERAREGLFTDFEIARGLPLHFRDAYFQRVPGGWRIRDEIRAAVTFRTANLLDPLDFVGTVDVVFCRNVLIYFDVDTKRAMVERIARVMRPDGFLVLGGAETLVGVTDRFLPLAPHRYLFRPNVAMAGHCDLAGAQPGERRPWTPLKDANAPAVQTAAQPTLLSNRRLRA